MRDEDKTREQLLAELAELRGRVREAEPAEKDAGGGPAIPSSWWRALVAGSPLFILIVDREYRIRFLNHTDSGVPSDQIVGMNLLELARPEERDRVRQALDGVFATGKAEVLQSLAVRTDDQAHWYEGHFGPVFENGRIVAASLIAVNVTARHAAEQERDRNQAILTATIECLPFNFFAIGRDGRYILQNAVSRQQSGYTIGKRPEEVARDPGDLRVWLENNRRAFAGERVEGEVELRFGGEVRHYYNVVTPIQSGGELYGILGINVDITARKQAEEELKRHQEHLEELVRERTRELEARNEQLGREIEERRQAEERYKTLVDACPDAVLTCDSAWRITYASRRACELFGCADPEELLGRAATDLVVEGERPRLLANLANLQEQGVRRNTAYRGLHKDGTTFAAEVSSAAMRDAQGRPRSFVAVIRDVTDRNRAEHALRDSEERFRVLFEEAPIGMVIGVGNGIITQTNRAICRMTGYAPEELIGRHVGEFTHPDDRELSAPMVRQLLAGEIPSFSLEKRYIAKGGRVFWAQATTAAVRGPGGRPAFAVGIVEDITERKQAREALQRERETLRHLLESSDHERQLIAYEIHDGLAQEIAAAMMHLETYQHLRWEQPDQAESAFQAGIKLIRQAHFEARRLISGVRPPVLDESGIDVALAHLVHDHQSPNGPQIEYDSDVQFVRLPSVLENGIYRIAQEALTNACKHSGSPNVRVRLVQEGDVARLEVRDWGRGFDPAAVGEDRFGLQGIRERVRLLGGQLELESRPGGGTRLEVRLPLVEASRPAS